MDDFLGGRPVAVLIKLAIVSIIVGIVLAALGLSPWELVAGIQRLIQRIYDLGFGAFETAFSYFVIGAVIVFPVWFILRLMKVSGRNRDRANKE